MMRFRPVSADGTTAAASPVSNNNTKEKHDTLPLGPLSPNHEIDCQKQKKTSSVKHHHDASINDIIGTPPSLKRHKASLEYPSDSCRIPIKNQIQSLYETASSNVTSHQYSLNDSCSGLLSLENVLLPAVLQKEQEALKKYESILKRYFSNGQIKALESCRWAVYESMASGMHAARQARLEREARETMLVQRKAEEVLEKRKIEKQQRQEERARRKQEREQQRALEKERRKAQEKKTHPSNVALWREVALLMTEIAKLEKEERMWKDAQQKLTVKQGELEQKKELQKDMTEEEQQDEEEDESVMDEEQKVQDTIQGILLSSVRIQQALGIVSDLMTESDTVRKEIYSKYKEDHQFHGYRGVADPKGLIRAMTMTAE